MNAHRIFSEFHRETLGILTEKGYSEFSNIDESLFQFLMERYSAEKVNENSWRLEAVTEIAGHYICRQITWTLASRKFFGGESFSAIVGYETFIDGEMIGSRSVSEEIMMIWFLYKIESSLNDWSEFPCDLNEREIKVCVALKSLFKESKKFYCKVKPDDSLRAFSLMADRFLGYEYAARMICDSIDEKYRLFITGLEIRNDYIYPVFDGGAFYEDMDKYIEAKSAWCKKNGCE